MIPRQARILILGAGAGGLSAALFLRKRGFTNVTLFEKRDRIGGMCCTVTQGDRSLDLGATFVTPAYREILRMARQAAAKLERIDGWTAFAFDERRQSAGYYGLWDYILGGTSFLAACRFVWLCLVYLWRRFRLRKALRPSGWIGISAHPELCVSFSQWLRDNRLAGLTRGFEIPIATFGYGSLDEIPAPYALKYMSAGVILAVMFTFTPLAPWTPAFLTVRRFRHGFQSFWERVARDLDVRLSVEVKKIERRDDGIGVLYQHRQKTNGGEDSAVEARAEFDYLIVACSLRGSELERALDLTDEERELQAKIRIIPCASAILEPGALRLPGELAFHAPAPFPDRPMFFHQPRRENAMLSVFGRLAGDDAPASGEDAPFPGIVAQCVSALGGRPGQPGHWRALEAWPYFKHVGIEEFRQGYFDRWAQTQGRRRTFFVGGLFDFDCVEGVVRYSRALVERHFAASTKQAMQSSS